MKLLEGGSRVFSAEDGTLHTVGNWTTRSVVSRESVDLWITEDVKTSPSALADLRPLMVRS